MNDYFNRLFESNKRLEEKIAKNCLYGLTGLFQAIDLPRKAYF